MPKASGHLIGNGLDSGDTLLQGVATLLEELRAGHPEGFERAVDTTTVYELADDLGPFYDSVGLQRRWSITRQAVSKRRHSGLILGVPTDDRRVLYPTWQFIAGTDAYPQVLDGLPDIMRVLRERYDSDLTSAMWLTTPSPQLDGRSAYQALADGDLPAVTALAAGDLASVRDE